MPKRAREEEEEISEEPVKRQRLLPKRKRSARKETPLSRFRKQTILRKKALLKVIKESNSELRAIARDLGKLQKNKNGV